MKKLLLLLVCFISLNTYSQTLYVPNGANGIGNSSNGKIGIGTSNPQADLEVVGFGQFNRNPSSTGYTTLRLFNDVNYAFRALEIDYAGSAYAGSLVNSGPTGESASITTTGAYPLTLGTGNTARLTVAGGGNVGVGTSNPWDKFHVNGTLGIGTWNGDPHSGLQMQYSETGGSGTTVFKHQRWSGDFYFKRNDAAGERTQLYFGGSSNHYMDIYNGNNQVNIRLNTSGDSFFNGGNVGVGTASPDGFQVNSVIGQETSKGVNNIRFGVMAGTPRMIFDSGGNTPFEIDNSNGLFRIFTPGQVKLAITAGGYVGIGTSIPDAPLAVRGQVHAQEVKVDLNVPGPDYVFEKEYKLTSLEEIKNYIDHNKHLPEVPSAKEMEKNGVQLGEMNMLLLKKIEELTLHVIEQNKKLENYHRENLELREEIKSYSKK